MYLPVTVPFLSVDIMKGRAVRSNLSKSRSAFTGYEEKSMSRSISSTFVPLTSEESRVSAAWI